jgi:hypothetical protein
MGRHFVLVLFPNHLTDVEASAYLVRVMQPYDQQFDAFPSYHYPCLCTQTDDAGYTAANAEIGDFRTLWALYQLLPVDQRPAWFDYIAPWEEIADLAARLSPHYQAPHMDCPDCGGSGLMRVSTAYGGKYDYWRTRDGLEVCFPCPDIWPVSYLLKHFTVTECGALITPDGRWHEAEKGLWDYASSNWQRYALDLLEQFPQYMAIRCLFHH